MHRLTLLDLLIVLAVIGMLAYVSRFDAPRFANRTVPSPAAAGTTTNE